MYNSIIFNIINIPKTLILRIYNKKYQLFKKEKIYILKLLLLLLGIIIKSHIDNSYIFKWVKNELLEIKGMKLYSIFKIIEYMLLLINKFGYDLDLQLLKIINAKKTKHKIISFVFLVIYLYVNIYLLVLFYYCTWLIIFDNNKGFMQIYLKFNYIKFKQSNKSFKSLHNILSNDIHDRLLNYFILVFIFINGYIEGEVKLNINNIYLKRILFCFFAEFISDYIKGIILFKINNINPKAIKKFLKEEMIYYKELKNEEKNKEYNLLKNIKLYEQYSDIIDRENIICMFLNISILPFCILFLDFFVLQIKIFFLYKIIIFAFLICIKIFNEKIIDNSLFQKDDKKKDE